MIQESWKQIVLRGITYKYWVSNHGRVKNNKNEILKPWKRGQRKGTYLCVGLYGKGYRYKIDIQRLVALHFIPNPKNKPEVHHLNEDHFNNNVDNLEWRTRSENENYKTFIMFYSKHNRI